MNKFERIKYTELAGILKATAHPTRLFIIEQLEKSEMCVSSLTQMVDADASTVSKHLSVLKNAGLIESEKRGLHIFYKIKILCITDFLKCIDDMLQDSFKQNRTVMDCCNKIKDYSK